MLRASSAEETLLSLLGGDLLSVLLAFLPLPRRPPLLLEPYIALCASAFPSWYSAIVLLWSSCHSSESCRSWAPSSYVSEASLMASFSVAIWNGLCNGRENAAIIYTALRIKWGGRANGFSRRWWKWKGKLEEFWSKVSQSRKVTSYFTHLQCKYWFILYRKTPTPIYILPLGGLIMHSVHS